ncbi:MAG: hypothetical protein KGM17_06960 [Sphingomonadales bacterium]|nr:hypothetical protein [Sphingomonadales bacterium]
MAPLLFALLLALVAGIGARDQVLLAQLVARNGQRLSLLVVAIGTGAAACLAAGYAASRAVPELDRPVRLVAAAMALAIAGIEALAIGPPRPAREPTQSLAAAGIVFLAQQLTDSVRLALFAVALATASPFAVAGGLAGGSAALALGWLGGGKLAAGRRLRLARALCGIVLLAAAAGTLVQADGLSDRIWRSVSP